MTVLTEAAPPASSPRRPLSVAAILSLLLHLALFVGLTLWTLWSPAPPAPEEVVPVELSPAPQPAPPKPEIKPEPPKEEPPKPPPKLEEPKPEPPKPPPPKLEPSKQEPPKKPTPPKLDLPPPPAPIKRPPPPHLQKAPAAEESTPGDSEGASPARPQRPHRTAEQQQLRDVLLSQIARIWTPPPGSRGHGIFFTLKVDLKPDGMLGPPFAGDRPLDMRQAVDHWESLSPAAQDLLGGVARAIHMAQPFQLPPDMAAKAPTTVPLDFAIDDMP